MAQDGSFRTYATANRASATLVSEVYLVIEVPKTVGFVNELPLHVTAVPIQFAALEQKLVSSVAPSKVVVPLLTRGFDAADVVEQLGVCGYKGAVWVLAPKLPNRRMVERELRSMVSGITVEIIELDEIGPVFAQPSVHHMIRPH
jgi:hypothetical protein